MAAFEILPVWKGTAFRSMTMTDDYLGLTTKSAYQANDFWSSSEALAPAQRMLKESAGTKNPTQAVMSTISVSNGRDVARMSNVPEELEILLPPGSTYGITSRTLLKRGDDDEEIRKHFSEQFFKWFPSVTHFWVISLAQTTTGDQGSALPADATKGQAQKSVRTNRPRK